MGVSPQNGVAQVPINALATVQFNEPVDSESLGQVALSVNGMTVPASSSLTNGNQTLTLVPLAALAANTQYTLTVTGVIDLAGNSMAQPFTSSFTTGFVDFSQPVVTNVIPGNNTTGVLTTTTIQLQFSKLMNALTIGNATFTVRNGTTPIAGTISVSSDGTIATFTPSTALLISTIYTVSASSSILDLEGQALSNFQSTFTTGTQ